MSGRLLAVDPGSTESGWVVLDERNWITGKGITPNEEMLLLLRDWEEEVAIEKIESYGMSVGASIFPPASGRVGSYRSTDTRIGSSGCHVGR